MVKEVRDFSTAGMASTARWRAGNNVGVESEGVGTVLIEMLVMLLLLWFSAHGDPEDATFLAAAGCEDLIRSEQKGP